MRTSTRTHRFTAGRQQTITPRWQLAAAGLASLVACGTPTVEEGFSCAGDNDCLSGYRCDLANRTCVRRDADSGCSNGVCPESLTVALGGPIESGSTETGIAMKNGIEAYFRHVNANGYGGAGTSRGVQGRTLTLQTWDDGGQGSKAAKNAREGFGEKRDVFALVGSIGDEAAKNVLKITNEQEVLHFGALSGSQLLRREPPDSFVFTYRPSYGAETAAAIDYLTKRHSPQIPARNIMAFLQGFDAEVQGFVDAYGEGGFNGVKRTLADDYQIDGDTVPYTTYSIDRPKNVSRSALFILHWLAGADRNRMLESLSITDAIARNSWPSWKGIQQSSGDINAAIVGVPTAEPLAELVKAIRGELADIRADKSDGSDYGLNEDELAQLSRVKTLVFFSVSSVGSSALGRELSEIDPTLCRNVIVSEVVPYPGSESEIVREYREHLAAQTDLPPDPISLEGYLVARLFVEGLHRHGAKALTSQELVKTFEALEVDYGFGDSLGFDKSSHQASSRVWGTTLDSECTPQPIANW
jgi:hypothetical protein